MGHYLHEDGTKGKEKTHSFGIGLKKMMMIRRMGRKVLEVFVSALITIGLLPWRISALTLRQLIRTLYLSLPSTKNYVTNVTLPGARPDYLCRGKDVT